ncbi:glycosyltransferase family 2 protein [Paenibacillus sp. SC116]|uniref:glycosyltransferase family 2 protein n=1 Tax=Paenibacillus sp. SC116 TaxID=2968986 RepID=UPI00215B04EC|nr:glycosyltransferase family 2 protein [Paenibacillus sp. SC116]MCR8845123.1 glycosyltransferase family 2 protein [Paenibacillus sp. SC116]
MFISHGNRNFTIGVLILARDEAALIGPCLDSVKEADVCLVADTGSFDGTSEIALQHGAHVVQLQWNNDFAEARNEALQHMTTDWVLVLDADERLISSIQEVRQWIYHTNCEGSTVKIINRLSEEDVQLAVCHRAVRLFRRRDNFHYKGMIHEDIGPSITEIYEDTALADSAITIEHIGTLPQHIQRKNKPERNKQLLLKNIELQPTDAFLLYGLGVTAVQQQQLDEAYRWFSLSRENVDAQVAYRPTLYRDTIKVLLAQHKPHIAEEWLQEAISSYAEYSELYILQGQSLFQQGLLNEALHSFQHALTTSSDHYHYVTENGSSSYIAHTWIGETYRQLRQHGEALKSFNAALVDHPQYEPALHGFIAAAVELNVSEEEVTAHIESLWKEIEFPSAVILVRVYKQAGYHHSLAQLCVNRLSTPQAIYGLTIAWIHKERYAEANGMLHHLLQTTRLHDNERRQLEDWQAICAWQSHLQGKPTLVNSDNWEPAVREAYKLLTKSSPSMASGKAYIHKYTVDHTEQSAETNQHKRDFDENGDTAHFEGSQHSEIYKVLDRWIELLRDEALIQPLQKWAFHDGDRDLYCAKALYVAGDIYSSAEILLKAMAEQRLDAEGAMLLGELLMQKQHWQEALDLLEGARLLHQEQEKIDQDVAARLDRMLALTYVRLSEHYLQQAIALEPQQQAWEEQLRVIRLAIEQLSVTPWELPRTTLQRRNIQLVQSEAVRLSHRSE